MPVLGVKQSGITHTTIAFHMCYVLVCLFKVPQVLTTALPSLFASKKCCPYSSSLGDCEDPSSLAVVIRPCYSLPSHDANKMELKSNLILQVECCMSLIRARHKKTSFYEIYQQRFRYLHSFRFQELSILSHSSYNFCIEGDNLIVAIASSCTGYWHYHVHY